MKKIYTLIALAFAAMSASADVVLTMGGEVCDPSKTVEILAVEENYGDETEPYIMIQNGQTDPQVKNTGSSTASVAVTVESENWKCFTWCGFATQCQPLKGSSETRTGSINANSSVSLILEAEFGEKDENLRTFWGPKYYTSYPAKVTVKSGSTSTTYNLLFVYDERSSCGIFPKDETGINTVLRGEDNAPRYDLQGRRTSNTANGLFIKNGRKYIQK